jgi:PAS domain S-box-containing protein
LITPHVDVAPPRRAVLVDTDTDFARQVEEQLVAGAVPLVIVSHVVSLDQADTTLAKGGVDLLLFGLELSLASREWLQRHAAAGRVPVVVLGRDEGPEALAAARASGADDYLAKSAADANGLTEASRHAIECHELREQLRQSIRRLGDLLKNATDLIAVVDLDGSVAYISPAVERMLGVTPDVLIGTRLWDRLHLDDVLPMQAVMLELATEPQSQRECEFRLAGAEDAWHTLEAVGRVLIEGGRRQIVLNARDVSAPRRAEQALAQREALLLHAQKMETLGRLAGGVAHDLSNVLTVILGATERLLDRLPAEGASRSEAESVRDAAERAVDLTTQLLAFSRRQAVAPTVLAIADVLTGVGRFLRPLIGEDIVLQVSVGPGTGSIRADRTKIEQVILNLATNARDAMPAGGCLTIAVNAAALAAPTTVDGTPLAAGPYVMIRVEDTGAGMDEETLARAFEPFFSTKGPGRGTGIGLATVHGIVTQCGGAVALTSRVGVGTTVTVYLPQVAAEAVVEPHVQPDLSAPAGGTETVLLVEDEHEVRELVRDMLEMAGYSVLEAKLPRAAEAMCRQHKGPVHLLLTDVVMPELSGREVAKRIRAASPSTKVLFMSGYPDYPGSSSEVSGFEGVEYLAKPFDRRLLLTRVRGMLDGATV